MTIKLSKYYEKDDPEDYYYRIDKTTLAFSQSITLLTDHDIDELYEQIKHNMSITYAEEEKKAYNEIIHRLDNLDERLDKLELNKQSSSKPKQKKKNKTHNKK